MLCSGANEGGVAVKRVKLTDVLKNDQPLSLPMYNDLPFFNDASHKFVVGA